MEYTIHRRARMRSIRLAVHADGSLVVSAAIMISPQTIERLVREKSSWIERQRAKMKARVRVAPAPSLPDYRLHKQAALALVKERIAVFSSFYGFEPKRVSIGNARTRWGSCSRRGSLTFSYRIIFLSPELRDYLIVHELCHLKEFNHSVRFWALVGKAIPHWKMLRRQLRMG